MNIGQHIQNFIEYIQFEKRYSPHTATGYTKDLEQFRLFILDQYQEDKIEQVSPSIIRSWMAHLKNEENDSAKTIRRKISALKSFCKYLLRESIITKNPTETLTLPKVNKRIPVFLPQSDTDKISDVIVYSEGWKGENEQLILHILYATGIRLSELIHIKESDVDYSYEQIKVMGKGNKERVIPIGHELKNHFQTYIAAKKDLNITSDYLLALENGKKLYPKYIYNITKEKLSLITTQHKKSPHVLRHTFATQILNNGADINSVKELLGHSSLAATQVYTHNTIEKLKEVFKQAHPKG